MNAVRAARLQNIVDYKVTVVKPITFNLRDKNNNQLYDLEGEPLQVTVDVAFSGTFNYWDYGETDKNSGNECPPLQGNQDWRRGDIPNHDMSGMDFVLNGDANDPNSPLVAVEITKVIVDENGNILKVDKPVTSTVSLYRSATADRNGVKDYQIGDESNPKRDDDTGIYDESYTFVRDHKIVVDEGTGSRLIYDYHVSDGMYYIVERTDEDSGFAETITSGGEEWKYVKTYIDTEYVKRDYSYDELNDRNPMHRSGDYTLGDEYKSSPEVVGWFNTVTGERKKSAFLEYYVYNVYTKGKTLNVEKRWALPEGEEAPAGAAVEVELYYATRANSSEAWPERTQENYTKLVPGTAPFEDYTAESLKTALALNQDNNWKGLFDGLPDKVTVDGTPCEVDYCAFETAVKLPGPGKTQVDETAIDVTKGYSVAYSDEDGREIITNTREVVELGAKKKWAEGTEIPEGAEVTVELRFATRLIVNAEGEAVEPLEDWPEDPEAEGAYLPVKDSTGYARVFQNDPRFDEATLVTERVLTVDSEHLDSSWMDVFENLPKYLLTEEGILEVDYYAFETKVMVPDGQTQKDVMGDYAVTTVKEGVEDEGSNGMVTITNENNVTSLEVEKIWAKGTTEPDGAEVTVELRFAARMIRNADGTAVVPLPDWPMSEGSVDYESYQPVVKTDGVFDDLFKNARSFDADNSTLVTELTLKADAKHPEYSWYGIFENLPKYLRDADGTTWELDYYAVETTVKVPGEGEDGETMVDRLNDYQHVGVKTDAEGEAANTSDGEVKITNTDSVVIEVEKKWEPSEPDGAEAVVQLKRYMAEGKPAMPQTEATIVKVWDDADNQDGKRPDSLTVTLSNGESVTLNEDNGWKYTVNNLNEYSDDEHKTPIVYTWTEDTANLPEGYTLTNMVTRGTVTTLTNSYTPGKTAATVAVIWDDGNDQDGKRPGSVEMTLSNGTSVTLNADNNWTVTVNNLPEYAEGTKINYAWTAPGVTDYGTPSSSTNDTVTTFTYSHVTEKTERTVRIVWDDENDQDGIRPESVSAMLSNGEVVTLTAADGWIHTVSNLSANAAGQPVSYTWSGEYVGGYTTTSETSGTVTTLTYSYTPQPPKDYVTVTIHTILREAQEGYYTDWEVNGWSTNIYNLEAQYQNHTITMSTIEQEQGDSGLHWNDQKSYASRGPLSFDVDKNTTVKFHMDIGGTDVSLVDVAISNGTVSKSGSNKSVDIQFDSGAKDINVYVVLKGEETKLPENSTVYMVLVNGNPVNASGVPKDPNGSTNGYVGAVTVPVNSSVCFNYDSYYYAPWNSNIEPKYKVFYWHDTQYEHKWEAVSPEISGETPPDDDVVFNVGMKERYLVVVAADPQFKGNLNCKLEPLSTSNAASSGNSLLSAGLAGSRMVASRAMGMSNTANGSNPSPAFRVNAAPLRVAHTSVTISQNVKCPEGYGVDQAFSERNITLTLNDTNGWTQSFPPQDKYDEYGRKYIYFVEEIDFSPSDGYYTESITGPDENGKVTIVNKHEEEEPDTGILKLKKLVAINGKEFANGDTRVDGEYTFIISGKSGTDTASVAEKVVKIQVTGGQPVSATLDGTTVELDENQFVTISGLLYGDYVITEDITALGNDVELYSIVGGRNDGDCAVGTITVTVGETHSASAEAVFVNNYTENYEVDIVKVEKGTEVPLDGAVFTLTQVWEDGRYLMVDGSNENYVKREVKTTSDGTLAFTGLISGIYEIEETMPPEHYVLDSNIVFYVKIDAGVVNWVAKGETGWIVKTGKDGAVSFTEAHAAIEADPENEIEAKDATNAVFTVENTPGMSLPSTGGPGTNLLYLIGIMLITLASMALIMKQKGNH